MASKILVLVFLAATFTSCSSSRKTASDTNHSQLIFGNGGGFTGKYISYKLEDDGRVYSRLPDSTWKRSNRIGKKLCRALFASASELKTTQPATNYPGNITWFIQYQKGNELVEYKWGNSDFTVPGPIKNLYNQLINTVN